MEFLLFWGVGFGFLSSLPPLFALWHIKVLKLAVGTGSGVWGGGVLESSQKWKKLPNWLSMLDLPLLQ